MMRALLWQGNTGGIFMDSKLKGQVAVITGGASGLGRASAERFAAEGADLVLADLNERAGEETAAAIAAETGQQVEFFELDVTDEEKTDALMRHAVDAFGRLDVVLAAAGVSSAGYVSGQVTVRIDDPETNYLVNKPPADWRQVIDINLTGVMLTARAAAQAMIGLGSPGSIINIASVAGRVPLAGAAEYSVSKAGVIMLTQVLGRELADHGIRVNAIGPGFIETPMTAGVRQDPEGVEMVMAMTPMQRFGQPSEVASTALFLASDESSYFTGQTLYPNGGINVG